jgi:hypothetical protein
VGRGHRRGPSTRVLGDTTYDAARAAL